MRTFATTVTTLAALTTAGTGLAVPFAEVAPSDAVMVIEVPSVERMMEGVERAGLRAMIDDRAFRSFGEALLDAAGGDGEVGFTDVLDELDIELDELSMPTGQIGFAFGAGADSVAGFGEMDLESAMGGSSIVLMAEFDGAGADAMRAALERLIDEGIDRDLIRLDDVDPVGDVEIVGIDSVIAEELFEQQMAVEEEFSRRAEELREANDWEAWGELWEWYEQAFEEVGSDDPLERAMQNLYAQLDDMHMAWVGDTMVASTIPESVIDAVEAMQDGRDESLAGSDFYADSIAALPDEHHARFMVNLKAMNELNAAMMEDMGDPEMLDEMEAMQRAMGTDANHAIAASLTVGEAGEVVRLDSVTFLDEARGLYALFDLEGAPFTGTPVLPSDAIMGGRVLFDFASVIEVAQAAIAGMPQMMRDDLEPGFMQFSAIAAPILNVLGPEVYLGVDEFDPESLAGGMAMMMMGGDTPPVVLGVSVKDETIISNLVTTFGAAAGIESRDFGGGQVFGIEGVDVAMGLGFGHAVIGGEANVEDALRRLADPSIAAFGSGERFRAAMENVDSSGQAVWFAETSRLYELVQDFISAGMEQRQEWDDEFEPPAWFEEMPDPEDMGTYLGDIVLDQHMRDEGLVGTLILLKP